MINRAVKPDIQRTIERDPIRVNFYRYHETLDVDVIVSGEDWSLELSWDETPDISPKKFTPELSDREAVEVTSLILKVWTEETAKRNESKEAS